MRKLSTVTFSSILLATANFAVPASAADLAVKARPMAPVAAAFSWSGCYIGANGGWVHQRSGFDTSPSGSYLNTAGFAAPPNAAGTGLLPGDLASAQHSYRANGDGGTVGGQIGCNMQFGSLLLGVEGDLNWANATSSVNATFAPFPSANPAFTISQENESLSTRLDWFSTIRARGGIALDHWLLYATGGLAIGHFRSNTNIAYAANGTSPVFANSLHVGESTITRLGLAVGGGIEYAVDPNWSVKAEYLFMTFGNFSYSSPLVAPVGSAAAGYSWTTTVTPREHIFRVGLNYRFGGAPLVARY
jgi:outer membrane immunogenic protein